MLVYTGMWIKTNHVCLNVSNLTGEAQEVTTARKKQMIAALFTKRWYIHTQTYKQAHTPTAQPHKCWNPQWRNIKQQQVLLEYGQMHSPHSWGSIRSPLYREVRLLSRSLSLPLCYIKKKKKGPHAHAVCIATTSCWGSGRGYFVSVVCLCVCELKCVLVCLIPAE